MNPLRTLFERPGLAASALPSRLREGYGGGFGLSRPGVYGNFVSSADGVVALPGGGESGHLISGGNEADRLIMGLLRASSDAVLIGAGTFRQAPGQTWVAQAIFPEAAGCFAELRDQLRLRPNPVLVIVTASGNLDPTQPALRDSLILTTARGEGVLRGRLPEGARLVVFAGADLGVRSILKFLNGEGLGVILAEGGPTLFGRLLKEEVIDELFLTIAPKLYGRSSGDGRMALAAGVDLAGKSMELLSLRSDGSHLFLRYGLRR
jgi:riboflavin biosynthesis pyrimidine reductase